MPIDFQSFHQRMPALERDARQQRAQAQDSCVQAQEWLAHYANKPEELQRKVEQAVAQNSKLRCALPTSEGFDRGYPLPPMPDAMTLIAADGSQIFASHHEAIEYSLVNVGTVTFFHGHKQDPKRQSFTDIQLGFKSDDEVSLKRDLSEREQLAKMALNAPRPTLALTDGPLELWGREGQGHYAESLNTYLGSLQQLQQAKVGTAGYVDRPAGNYVVELLEIAAHPLDEIWNSKRLEGARDLDLYQDLIEPGERSALFKSVSTLARRFEDHDPGLALYFFYLNVGRPSKPWLARVEVPDWVATDNKMLNALHAVLVDQAGIMGARPYPYILHRAHEEALVSFDEKALIDQHLARALGTFSGPSNKLAGKSLSTQKTRYS